ncbi:hypothetical protein Tco_0659255 [Tanacetum coccineum]|uniref:Uncharacterized protein n=1 Tax=Tanacetum coccineum TaxID=301880 RepID=A0ABQ4WG20_9ASTR
MRVITNNMRLREQHSITAIFDVLGSTWTCSVWNSTIKHQNATVSVDTGREGYANDVIQRKILSTSSKDDSGGFFCNFLMFWTERCITDVDEKHFLQKIMVHWPRDSSRGHDESSGPELTRAEPLEIWMHPSKVT